MKVFLTVNIEFKWIRYWLSLLAILPLVPGSLSNRACRLTFMSSTCSSLYSLYPLKYLEEPCVWVESNTTTLSRLTSHAEIGLGFLFNYFSILVATQHNTNIHYWQSNGDAIAAETAMATTPLPEQQEPAIYPEDVSSSAWHNSGSIGPFFAVISVLTVLAVLSCLLGRVCGKQAVDPLENIRHEGCLGWVRRKWSRYIAGDAEMRVEVVAAKEGNGKAQDSDPPHPPPV
ncbi:hypothetical protein HHK36_007065 [Tetracentron sinense]|uniref:Uncharacterized protein n=1 Tax=Tetracentron sinense TaxID=13715 RepID=A0A834ZLU2_TETSI|nr:hypothetical protein HHK36_007065 [Tetracentron sinense]